MQWDLSWAARRSPFNKRPPPRISSGTARQAKRQNKSSKHRPKRFAKHGLANQILKKRPA
eukprot:9261508-Pyramimonas_sp.AAC.1